MDNRIGAKDIGKVLSCGRRLGQVLADSEVKSYKIPAPTLTRHLQTFDLPAFRSTVRSTGFADQGKHDHAYFKDRSPSVHFTLPKLLAFPCFRGQCRISIQPLILLFFW